MLQFHYSMYGIGVLGVLRTKIPGDADWYSFCFYQPQSMQMSQSAFSAQSRETQHEHATANVTKTAIIGVLVFIHTTTHRSPSVSRNSPLCCAVRASSAAPEIEYAKHLRGMIGKLTALEVRARTSYS